MRERHPANAPGDWYVDRDCINCKAAQTVAPGLIVERHGQSVFAHQPQTPDERLQAWRARLLCPTASVRSEAALKAPADAFPEPMTERVYRLGFNARSSWGAHSFLMRRTQGNVMVDAPRFASQVVEAIAAWGGLADILLTHRDDVADADRYAERFGASVWIHDADRGAAPYATQLLHGIEPTRIAADILAIPLPGHTAGSVAYLFEERCLFTGDSLAWDFAANDLTAHRHVCWYSWPEQLASLRRLLDHQFEWVLAGHGGSKRLPATEMNRRLAVLLDRLDA
jgi:glyoxylase-like metal-dependent hydrolase (beta-lactamase superfamily II)